MRCGRHADRAGGAHLIRAVLGAHLLVIPVVVLAVPRYLDEVLVALDKAVALGRRVTAAVLHVLVHAEYVALAVQVRPGLGLVRGTRLRANRRMQGVVLVVQCRALGATIRVDQVLDIAYVAIAELATGLGPVDVAQESGTDRLLVFLVDGRGKEAADFIHAE